MEVRIGAVHSAKELVVELEESADQVVKLVDKAVAGGEGVLWLRDAKGRRVGVPVERLAYVEIGEESADRHVGFGRAAATGSRGGK